MDTLPTDSQEMEQLASSMAAMSLNSPQGVPQSPADKKGVDDILTKRTLELGELSDHDDAPKGSKDSSSKGSSKLNEQKTKDYSELIKKVGALKQSSGSIDHVVQSLENNKVSYHVKILKHSDIIICQPTSNPISIPQVDLEVETMNPRPADILASCTKQTAISPDEQRGQFNVAGRRR